MEHALAAPGFSRPSWQFRRAPDDSFDGSTCADLSTHLSDTGIPAKLPQPGSCVLPG